MAVKYNAVMKQKYEQMWATCEVDYQQSTVAAVAKRVLAVKGQCTGYDPVPWWFIALCWLRECNLNPKGVLHNGETIIGTGRKTRLEPKDCGPFNTWAEATKDALAIKGYDKITDWSVGRVLYMFEGFNGFGYYNKGVPSPYLWSHTNKYADGTWDDDPKGGKYYADHKWSPDIYDPQIGVCAVLKELIKLDPSISFGVSAPSQSKPVAQPLGKGAAVRGKEDGTAPVGGSKASLPATTGLSALAAAVVAVAYAYWPLALGLVVLGGLGYGLWRTLKNRPKSQPQEPPAEEQKQKNP